MNNIETSIDNQEKIVLEGSSASQVKFPHLDNYKSRIGYSSADSLIFINNVLNKSISEFKCKDNWLDITVPIMSNCDKDYESLDNLINGSIIQLLISESGPVIFREFKNVSVCRQEFCHNINCIILENTYKCSTSDPTPFVTLSESKFIEKFGKLIKRTDNGEYVDIKQKELL